MDEREQGTETPGKHRKEGLLDKIGMHVPEGKRDRLHIQPRFFKFLGFLGVLFLLFSVGMFEFSPSPYFCASCHIMKPYYQAVSAGRGVHNHKLSREMLRAAQADLGKVLAAKRKK